VLHDVELTLPEGALVRVVGRNGAGKSTLLRLLTGTTAPARGTIAGIPGVVGYAPERFPRGQPFTVRAYLRHMARLRGLRRGPAKEAVTAVTERLAMTELLRTPLRELSKGAAHKVGLAQAFLAPSGLLVLDEPFSGLDDQARTAVTAMIREGARDGAAVVFSAHGPTSGLADVPRWLVAEGGVRAIAPDEPAGEAESEAAAEADPPPIRIELTVPEDEAERVERSLRARGYEPRRVAG
jgi:ABC-type multidrug transport system ATPase subunit